MRITCPFCGPRDHAEFCHGGDAGARRPAHDDDDNEAWVQYVYFRDNPRGLIKEYWQHVEGCRCWLMVERNTLTHEILQVCLASDDSEQNT